MIPISRDFRLKKEMDGVTYVFLPPVGDVEVELVSQTRTGEPSKAELSVAYKKAVDELEKEYNGKRHPQKKKWEALIAERAKNYIPDDDEREKIKSINDCINLVLVGWEGKDLPEFPEDNPASMLTLNTKGDLYEWYWNQYPLTLDDLKN